MRDFFQILILVVLLQEALYYVFVNPWRRTKSEPNAKWDSKSREVDEGKGFGAKLFLVIRITQVRPVTGDLVVAHGTNRNLISRQEGK